MQKHSAKGFGFRGWMLVVYQFLAYIAFVAFTNWPMNALSDLYSHDNPQLLSTIYTIAMIIGIAIQFVLSANIGKVKNIKRLSIWLGVVSMVFAAGVMLIPFYMKTLWLVAYFLECLIVTIWCTFIIGILIGQWFPRRKGTVMGIVTIAFPVGNALLSPFASAVFAPAAAGGMPNPTIAFLPYFIICCVGILVGAVFVKDYPEQCGAYRDNDKSLTPEIANAMMVQEIENKKTTVWNIKHTFGCLDFWLLTIPSGFLLFGAVGMMTQTTGIIGSYGYGPNTPQFGIIMLCVSAVAVLGSYILGLVDTRIGTKKAMIISCGIMVLSGIFGAIKSFPCLIVALMLLGIFMGASSNFTVSAAVQYWRREDFPSVFARVNAIANLINAIGPAIIAMILYKNGYSADFILVGVLGAVGIVMLLLVRANRIKAKDDSYRAAAGKPLDNALEGRK